MENEQVPEVTPEDLFAMYENRLQEQTAILFALINKLGGDVVITNEDFETKDGHDSVLADNIDETSLRLRLGKSEEVESGQ